MQYRLIEKNPIYGFFGRLISVEDFKRIPFNDKALFDPAGPTEVFFYRICIDSQQEGKSCYGLDDFTELTEFIKALPGINSNKICSISKNVQEGRNFQMTIKDNYIAHFTPNML